MFSLGFLFALSSADFNITQRNFQSALCKNSFSYLPIILIKYKNRMKTHKNIKLLAWFNFFTDFKLYSAIAIIYFSQVTHSLALGMSIFSIASISDAVFELPTGVLSDMVGRKN